MSQVSTLLSYLGRSKSFGPIAKLSNIYQPRQISPKNVIIENAAQLLVNHGFVHQSGSGLYTILNLCQRVVNKLQHLVDAHMAAIGASEITMPCLTPAHLWQKTGRMDAIGSELMVVSDRHNKSYILSPTHEEAVCSILSGLRDLSYTSLPLRLYQTTTKFRDELRPRRALLRSREFLMKDLYTFDTDEASAIETYGQVTQAYNDLFTAVGLPFHRVSGSCGAVGGQFSNEYHYESPAGQDTLLQCGHCDTIYNRDHIVEQNLPTDICPGCAHDTLHERTGIEVGHTFLLGDHYSAPLNAVFKDKEDKPRPLVMGCYGIGVTRLLQAAIEVTSSVSTNNDIVWPWHIAPYKLCIIGPKSGSREWSASSWVEPTALAVGQQTQLSADDIILDDRHNRTIGARIKEARQTGYPLIVVVGRGALQDKPVFELIDNTARFRSIRLFAEGKTGAVIPRLDDTNTTKGGGIQLTQLELLQTIDNVCAAMR